MLGRRPETSPMPSSLKPYNMKSKFLFDRTVVTGAIRFNDLIYISVTDDNVPQSIEHSHFFGYDQGIIGYSCISPWHTCSIAICEHPIQQMLAISPHGHVKLIGQGQDGDELISTPNGSPGTRGYLRHVRTIGRRTFAVGMGRQVYRRDDKDQWACLDQEIRPATGELKGFECIDGFSENNIYAVGWDGEIWHFDGTRWSQENSPTSEILTRILCTGDGYIYASGRRGLLLRKREQQWEVLAQGTITDDIWDLAWFQDRLYLSTLQGIFTLHKEEITAVDFGADIPRSCYHLSTADGVLWSFGAKDLMAFDGKTWSRID